MCVAGLLVATLLVQETRKASEGVNSAHCVSNLKQIGHALANYHSAYGCFPPAFVADTDGKPMHSWRVLILPFLEEKKAYEAYDFSEPWNGPNNHKLSANRGSRFFGCRSESLEPLPMTSYVAVIGPGTAWPGDKSAKVADVAETRSTTIHLIEVAQSGIHWMEPRDLTLNEAVASVNSKLNSFRSSPSGHRPHYVTVGRYVETFPAAVGRDELRAMFRRSSDFVEPTSNKDVD